MLFIIYQYLIIPLEHSLSLFTNTGLLQKKPQFSYLFQKRNMTVSYEILVILRHYWKKVFTAAEATREIIKYEGEGVLDQRTARRWFEKFRSGDTTLERKKGSGRPLMDIDEVLKEAVESNPSTSTRELARECGVSKDTVSRHLLSMGKVKKSSRLVPHELTPQQSGKRLEICENLLKNPSDMRFYRKIVTCDEIWVYWRNPNTHKQWLDRGQTALPVAARGQYEKKSMLCVFWNFEGVIHHEFVPDGCSMNSELYCEQLERLYAKLSERYPALINRKGVLFQQDNARPHTSRRTKEKFTELHGFELLPHPPYSPDLAPSDYYLFRSMAHFLQGKKFDNFAEVENAVQEFFDSHPKEWYQRGIEQLASRWLMTVDNNGLYFEY